MHSFQVLCGLSAVVFGAGANAAYTLQDNYDHTNFFDGFSFFDGADPTHGSVDFVTAATANATSLAGYAGTNGSRNSIYLGVDHTTMNPSNGRASTRVSSNKTYTRGLFIADIEHMPGAECGVWPAFWTFGPNWPSNGEIDIIEGVNAATSNAETLHTSSGCTVQKTGASLSSTDCNNGNGNNGCSASTSASNNYGAGFNAINGGVYAMEWTSSAISIWFFPRSAIPSDITAGAPQPTSWAAPPTKFTGAGCDIDAHFAEHQIIFDTTFCGDWAGKDWTQNSECSALAQTCDAYVAANPAAFKSAYWQIASVKVYEDASQSTTRGVPREFNA